MDRRVRTIGAEQPTHDLGREVRAPGEVGFGHPEYFTSLVERLYQAVDLVDASPRQVMFGVRIPLAVPRLMAAVNQVIMMALAMQIIAGMVGGAGLGYKVYEALQRSYFGQGFEAGLALVLMAMVRRRARGGRGVG